MSDASNETRPIQICICGGGNGSHTAAGYIGSKPGYIVNVLTRQPAKWLEGIAENGGIKVHTRECGKTEMKTVIGKLNKVSADAAEVAPGTDIFILGGPAHANPHLLKAIAPYVKDNAWVGSLYAQGGFDWAARDAIGEQRIKDGNILIFGLQNIPWICKATVYGKEAKMIGPKKFLLTASYPIERSTEVAEMLGKLFDIPCRTLPNFMCLTLTPSNQIIHPGRYYGIFKDWDGKRTYDAATIPMLYEGMDDFSAQQLQDLSDELQLIRRGLEARYPQLNLAPVMDLGERIIDQYGEDVKDRSSLRAIFATNLGYAGVRTPVKEVEPGRVIPVVESRFFIEDIPFGLCILRDIGSMLGIATPVFDKFIRWHQQFMGKTYLNDDGTLNKESLHETGAPSRYGITTVDQLVELSLPKN
eukprot:GEZU01029125.1.p1 GENE.GEZU01029125.1~~GEZU01029125.1.p1  ORF type:complete len:416 (-),score=164.39 GEZU01029125.1:1542-2789(-)